MEFLNFKWQLKCSTAAKIQSGSEEKWQLKGTDILSKIPVYHYYLQDRWEKKYGCHTILPLLKSLGKLFVLYRQINLYWKFGVKKKKKK